MSRVTFYGVRGSIPVTGAEFNQFGGDTACICLEGPERTVILDAGTGIRALGKRLIQDETLGISRPCFLAFSHFHWDHIQGLPFFLPAYDSRRSFTISAFGREDSSRSLRDIFATQMQNEFFPVSLGDMGANIQFFQTEEPRFEVGRGSVIAVKHNHPGGAYSYRINDRNGKSVVYCTDIEHSESIDPQIVELARNADLLIHEGQYTPEELPRFKGWGHSSWEQAVRVAELAEVKQLVITHHDPDHDDSFLSEVEAQCQARFPACCLARQGMVLEI
ncbi:MAG: MBL fold metallo-hydrolase [Gammaproteobacteria bacterium]|nr:MBL fold metallo-hydrolase [Gammaproteobacteria bacterium]